MWTPTPGQVKALMPARVDGRAFAADTTPTLNQVGQVAGSIVDDVEAAVAPLLTDPSDPTVVRPLPAALFPMAVRAATLGAAADVEYGFWPEQQDGPDASGPRFERRYKEALERLMAAVGSYYAVDDAAAATAADGFVGSMETPLVSVVTPYIPGVERVLWLR